MERETQKEVEIKELRGYLFKKSPSFFAGWQVSSLPYSSVLFQERFIVLKDRRLSYYKDEKEAKAGAQPKGVINFDLLCECGVTCVQGAGNNEKN